MSRPTYTPGPGGYVLSVLVSLVVFPTLMTLPEGGWLELPVTIMIIVVFGWFLWLPMALVGVPLVHLFARHQRHQWVHVLTAGLTGALAGLLAGVIYPDPLIWVLPLGLATAVGRLAVVPLVNRPTTELVAARRD